MTKEEKLYIEYIPTSQLIPYARNPRKNDSGVDQLAKMIKEVGFLNPIIIDGKNEIICGHTRLKACNKIGIKSVPCIRAESLTDDQIKAYRILDNKAAEFSAWDNDLLQVEIASITTIDMASFDLIEMDDDGVAKAQKKSTKPYDRCHILITIPTEKIEEVAKVIKWVESKGYEYEQSNN